MVRREATHQLAAPSPVLTERQDLGQDVVARRQAFEELDGQRVVAHSTPAYGDDRQRRKLAAPWHP